MLKSSIFEIEREHRMNYQILATLLLAACGPTLLLAQGGKELLLHKPGECGAFDENQFSSQTSHNPETLVGINEFPWIAGIVYTVDKPNTKHKYPCSAVLISDRYLVANAFCMGSQTFGTPRAVVLGDWKLGNKFDAPDCNDEGTCSTPLMVGIQETVSHPNTSRTQKNDEIALIRLERSIEFTDFIRPICLPDAGVNDKDFVAQDLPLAGFLAAPLNGPDAPKGRSKNFVRIQSIAECNEIYSKFNTSLIESKNICANDCLDGKHFLAGAALMGVQVSQSQPQHYYLLALASYGLAQCSHKNPSIFTRVDGNLDWIKQTMY